ncbi:ArsR family transcriptional regulator [Bacillus sp. M6-12]|uniref:ArsR/SmtB family transcription factor n=1 Tax=Bacillus sp. M6-12 TaxID=2054166 RepID=UPI000C77A1A6|nr:metalloregulator ArsR/SmtB family transcription factor [Bacillus sp. M6-12]PLS17474.1 ArsR family transcriptional regulator [Bacillus sp. M6-12]
MQSREFKDSIYYHFSRVGKTLNSPKRIELLDILSQGPKSVEMLAKETEMSVANTSQHLQTLLEVRLVKFRKEGTFAVYQLANRKVCDLIQSLQKVAEDRFEEINQLRKDFIERPNQLESIGLEALLKRIDSGNITLVDVRPKSEYDARHIPGAISIPIEDLNKKLSELSKDKEIIAYCRGPYCVSATEAVELLKSYGFQAVRLEVGIQHWEKAKQNQFNLK